MKKYYNSVKLFAGNSLEIFTVALLIGLAVIELLSLAVPLIGNDSLRDFTDGLAHGMSMMIFLAPFMVQGSFMSGNISGSYGVNPLTAKVYRSMPNGLEHYKRMILGVNIYCLLMGAVAFAATVGTALIHGGKAFNQLIAVSVWLILHGIEIICAALSVPAIASLIMYYVFMIFYGMGIDFGVGFTEDNSSAEQSAVMLVVLAAAAVFAIICTAFSPVVAARKWNNSFKEKPDNKRKEAA